MRDYDRAIINRIAAGLRNCKTEPDFFLWVDPCDNLSWEGLSILGIKIITTTASVIYTPHGDSDLIFIPLWLNHDKSEILNFEKGYEQE